MKSIESNSPLPGAASAPHDVEQKVLERYRRGARVPEPALCSPVKYDPKWLEKLPREILQRDYGCGDPSRHVQEGETVLDLGSGSGKICYIISQMVGPRGRVIGIDFNEEMLAVARRHQDEFAKTVGYANVEFRKARIQDLALDAERLEAYLAGNPVRTSDDLLRLRAFEDHLCRTAPLIPDGSVDLIVSNCVLNLVRPEDKSALFREMHRVLREGGRIAISDIVADEVIPRHLQEDSDLWSGCVSGAFQERDFLKAFEEAGFHALAIEDWEDVPYRTVEGIEFRSVTLTAHKGKEGPCRDRNQAILYRGPWQSVTDDEEHVFPRGVRVAVCGRTFERLASAPYRNDLVFIRPKMEIPVESAPSFDCSRTSPRDPRESKGVDYRETSPDGGGCCAPSSECC